MQEHESYHKKMRRLFRTEDREDFTDDFVCTSCYQAFTRLRPIKDA